MTLLQELEAKVVEYASNNITAMMGTIQITQNEKSDLKRFYEQLDSADRVSAAAFVKSKGFRPRTVGARGATGLCFRPGSSFFFSSARDELSVYQALYAVGVTAPGAARTSSRYTVFGSSPAAAPLPWNAVSQPNVVAVQLATSGP